MCLALQNHGTSITITFQNFCPVSEAGLQGCMGFQKEGTLMHPENAMILKIRSPKKGPLVLGNPNEGFRKGRWSFLKIRGTLT